MHFDAATRIQAGEFYQLFTEFFGKTRAFKQATAKLCRLLTGRHPTMPGRVFTRDELEESIRKAVGQNKHDARDFFGAEALFIQYLTGEMIQQENMDPTRTVYDDTSRIINRYLSKVNQKCTEGDMAIVTSFLTLMMTDPGVLGYKYKFTIN